MTPPTRTQRLHFLSGLSGQTCRFSLSPPLQTEKGPGCSSLAGRHDLAGAAAKADWHGAFSVATRRQGQLVAILQEAALFAGRELDRRLAALADLQQRAEAGCVRARQGPGADQVARLKVAAIGGVMGDDLRCGPIHRGRRLRTRND